MLAGLKDVAVYLDDIVVGGVDESTHLENVQAVFGRLQEYGFKIRKEKCSFKRPQIKYLGYILDCDGLRPDPDKIAAITSMPAPSNETE
uniref:Reverse transcriptase domain-containing protein n=1 Tax=Anopheles dirus TaxID=7168 RepID=A0A182NQA0_9DIPT